MNEVQTFHDSEILLRMNVLASSGEATVAGLYALGIYSSQSIMLGFLLNALDIDRAERRVHGVLGKDTLQDGDEVRNFVAEAQ